MSTLISVTEATQNWADQRGLPMVFTAETGSTNDDAKAAAMSESEPLVIYVTAHQHSGRGRGTNTWLDTGSGESLLSTWSWKLSASPQAITAPRIGLAVFKAVSKTWPSLEWGLKAPNDIYLSGHKSGGLLVETVSSGSNFRLLIGLGLNILNHPRRFQEAEHISKKLGAAPDEGEWFQFLDDLHAEFTAALPEVVQTTLSENNREDLKDALNANSARPFTVTEVSAQGDLVHAQGKVRWTDL